MREGAFIPDIPHVSVAEFGRDGVPTPYQLNDFWDQCRPWLANEGVELYELVVPKVAWRPKCWRTPVVHAPPAQLPFAVDTHALNTAPNEYNTMDRLAPARDMFGRDLMLKLVDKDSAECAIFKGLLECSVFLDSQTFPCVLPPVRILDTPHGYVIVAMPMWGNPVYIEDLATVREVMQFMECILRGLTFLHNRRIAHRDICDYNMVINRYRVDHDRDLLKEDLRQHRVGDEVFYALMDYDQSIQLPQECSLRNCRRPASESTFGAEIYRPEDCASGEPTYNPFAFDVAMLGNVFRFHFSEVAPFAPSLVALFDRMTTPNTEKRFTAQEALQFFRDTTASLPGRTLDAHVVLKIGFAPMFDADIYWSKLAPESLAIYGVHRTPPPSWWTRVLDWMLSFSIGFRVIIPLRRILHV
ncbi:hypothetical protein K466DRAFT_545831 [Polyporus arcularius HHB13444]|uniref:Protein kinase domain-containing protein n=1 Tax=Polyporus arcularius HHB13444 TaxID=1314778 RepID=A0A5C3PH50_9APHY|nr:hypothetical protein K466DRAFT_545831 [Polyporus arcularius HHB13444]